MIIAIVNQHSSPERTVVARNLAVLRARSGRRVCLMTTAGNGNSDWSEERSHAGVQPWIETHQVGSRAVKTRLAALRPLFDDILIDAGTRDTGGCRCVLAESRLVVVPVRSGALELDLQYHLLARLHGARTFNPAMRVLFVAVSGGAGPGVSERAAVLAHVARVDDATLAETVLHAPAARDYGPGRCVSDATTCDPDAAAELRALYDEVYPAAAPMACVVQAQINHQESLTSRMSRQP
jgi:chromosome partitioning protein